MKPLFTIHAGEYLVGSYVEENFKELNVWIPSKDTGVDLLLSDRGATHTVSIQVKFSKDFLSTIMNPKFRQKGSKLKSCGWWTINREKLSKSTADFWVFVLLGFDATQDFIIIRPKDLLQRLTAIFGDRPSFQSYLWVTQKTCWEARGLSQGEQVRISMGNYEDKSRDLSECLNEWKPILQRLSYKG
jgi:hypothetical protein